MSVQMGHLQCLIAPSGYLIGHSAPAGPLATPKHASVCVRGLSHNHYDYFYNYQQEQHLLTNTYYTHGSKLCAEVISDFRAISKR